MGRLGGEEEMGEWGNDVTFFLIKKYDSGSRQLWSLRKSPKLAR